jgi:hypothetical protein
MLINLANASQSINSEGVLPGRHAELRGCWFINYYVQGRKTETSDHDSSASVSVMRIHAAAHHHLRPEICGAGLTWRLAFAERKATIPTDRCVLPNPHLAPVRYIVSLAHAFTFHFLKCASTALSPSTNFVEPESDPQIPRDQTKCTIGKPAVSNLRLEVRNFFLKNCHCLRNSKFNMYVRVIA